jgi:predicted DsbA family dithiol-disulfide isomerase
MSNPAKFKVEVWSDIMCPFCYIGKRNYEAAVAQFTGSEQIDLVWKSFQLDPTIPTPTDTSQTTLQYLSASKGMSPAQVQSMTQGVTQTARAAGLEYHLDKTLVTNTFDAQRVIQFSKTKGLGDLAEETLFYAYFTETKDIADHSVLKELGQKIGLTAEEVNEALTDELYAHRVRKDIQEAREIGVRGVPFFVFDRKYAVSGAQPPEAFLQTLQKSFSEWEQANPKIQLDITGGPACTPDGNCK